MRELLHSQGSGFGSACSSFDPEDLGGSRPKRRQRRRGEDDARPRAKAFDRIVKLCTVRDRSEKELSERLAREGYPPSQIKGALERAVACGLVDDQRFARVFVRSRVAMGKGPVVIARDLKKHGIALGSVEGWPEAFSCDEESLDVRAMDLLLKSPPRSKDPWSGAYRKLIARGYPPSVASRVSRSWCEGERERQALSE